MTCIYVRTYVLVGMYTHKHPHTNNPPHTLYVCNANICKFEVRPPRLVLVKDIMLFSLIDTLSSSGGRAQRPLAHCVCMEPSPPRIATEGHVAAETAVYYSHHLINPIISTKQKVNTTTLSILEKTLEYLKTYENTNTCLRHCRTHLIPVDCAVAICVKHVESSGKLLERQHTIYDVLKSQSDSPFS